MKPPWIVGAALGHDVDHGAAVASVLRLEIREHVHFGNRIERQDGRGIAKHAGLVDGRIVAVAVVHVGAVQQIIVGAAARAVHRELAEGTRRIGDLVGRAGHAGVQVDQLGVVAAVDGNAFDGLRGQDAANVGGRGVDLRRLRP